MREILKEALRPMDGLIFVAAIILFTQLDYAELTTVDMIYIGTFIIWMLLFCVRVYLLSRKAPGTGKKDRSC